MNIIEAIKSGRRFRRKSWTTILWLEAQTNDLLNRELKLPVEAITADDWEVEEVRVTITREQFDEAWDRAILKMEYRFTKDGLAKELGL